MTPENNVYLIFFYHYFIDSIFFSMIHKKPHLIIKNIIIMVKRLTLCTRINYSCGSTHNAKFVLVKMAFFVGGVVKGCFV